MLWLIFSACIAVRLTAVNSEGCTGFHYEGPNGQDAWGASYKQCAGKHQSPIDINSLHVKVVAMSPLQMEQFNSTVGKASLTNNGHTAMMILDTYTKPTISGGPLTADYDFAQLHFHWGVDDTCGSEDKHNGKSFPLELHIVFYKRECKCVDTALDYPDGLTVLACVFESTDKPNPKYQPFVQMLSQVTDPGAIAVFPKAPALYDLLPNDLSQYVTYNGSLTTPPCSEAVIWIDFLEPIKIASSQLAAFRRLRDAYGHPLLNNFRSIQPIGDRVVLRNMANRRDTNLGNNRVQIKSQVSVRTQIKEAVKSIPPPPPRKKPNPTVSCA